MAVIHVQTKGLEFGSVTSAALTFDNPTVTGNFIAVGIVAFKSGGPATFTVADNKGNSFLQAPSAGVDDGANFCAYVFRAFNITGGSSHQITVTPNAAATISFAVSEFSGINTTSPDDGGNAATAASQFPSTGDIVMTVGGLLYGVVSHNQGTISITPDGAFTQAFEDETASGTVPINVEYHITTGISSIPWTLGISAAFYAAGAGFKAAAGGSNPFLLVAN